MKLAIFGAPVAAIGWAVGIDGLVYSGGLWAASGLLIAAILANRSQEEHPSNSTLAIADVREIGQIQQPDNQQKPGTWPGFVLLLAISLASITLGIVGIGFEDAESLRWLPIAAGLLNIILTVLSIPSRLGIANSSQSTAQPLTPATFTIEGSRATGTYINGQPRIEFDLLIQPANAPEYRVKKKATVPAIAMGRIAVGDGFKAKVDLNNETRMEIDWAAPIKPR